MLFVFSHIFSPATKDNHILQNKTCATNRDNHQVPLHSREFYPKRGAKLDDVTAHQLMRRHKRLQQFKFIIKFLLRSQAHDVTQWNMLSVHGGCWGFRLSARWQHHTTLWLPQPDNLWVFVLNETKFRKTPEEKSTQIK